MKHLVYSIIVCLFISCQEDDPFAGAPSSVAYLDLSEAEYLTIGEDNFSLYKLKASTNNEMISEKVGFMDANQAPIDSLFSHMQLEEITRISEDLVGIRGSISVIIDTTEVYFESLLINIKSGKIYDFNGHFPYVNSKYLGSAYLQTDKDGNMYYFHEQFFNYVPSGIYRIGDVSGNIFQETYVPASQFDLDTPPFLISSSANCFYKSNGSLKIKTPSSGIIVVEDDMRNLFSFNEQTYATIEGDLVEVIVEGDTYDTKALNIPENVVLYDFDYFYEDSDFGFLITNAGDADPRMGIVFDHMMSDVMNLTIPTELMQKVNAIEFFGNGFVWMGSQGALNKELYRFDLTEVSFQEVSFPEIEGTHEAGVLGAYQVIKFPSNIEVYEYEFISSNEISFKGFDLSSEEDISGVFDIQGNLHVMDRVKNFNYSLLERIN